MTIQDAKDQAAIWFGYKNYQDAIIKIATNKSGDINHVIDRAMQIYAEAQVKNAKQDTLTEILSYIDSYHGSGHEFWWINSKVRDRVYQMLEKSKEEL